MAATGALRERAGGKCELCGAVDGLDGLELRPDAPAGAESSVLVCGACRGRIEAGGGAAPLDPKHWRSLGDSVWSEHTPVRVLLFRLLQRMGDDAWAQDLRGQIYLDDEALAWADAGGAAASDDDGGDAPVRDSNGTTLQAGDSVTLIKDLEVKGAGFTAKRGTLVKSIVLTGDPRYVEGKVNGIQIVLVAAFLKKA